MIEEYEELAQQAHELMWTLRLRWQEGERLERLYQKAQRRYYRRAELVEDAYRTRHEDSIESRAYDD